MTKRVVGILKWLENNHNGLDFDKKKAILEEAMGFLGMTGVKIIQGEGPQKDSIYLGGEEKFFRLAERFLNIVSCGVVSGRAFETGFLEDLRKMAKR